VKVIVNMGDFEWNYPSDISKFFVRKRDEILKNPY